MSWLTITWPADAAPSISTVVLTEGPARSSSRCESADEEAAELAAVHPGRHPQLHASRRWSRVDRQPGGAAACRRPRRRALGVRLPGEEHEQRVPAELQKAAAALVRDREELREAPTDDVDHLFGADLAVTGEALRELRETGDVDEEQGTVDHLPACGRPPRRPSRATGAARTAGGWARVRRRQCSWFGLMSGAALPAQSGSDGSG